MVVDSAHDASIAPMQKVALVVEDSPVEAKMIAAVLKKQGLTVVCAADGLSGLQKAREIFPDVIIMDVNMPGMNGFQVVQTLKDDAQYADIPIVMLTTCDTSEAATTGFKVGVIDYIPKDVYAMRVLVETIQQIGIV